MTPARLKTATTRIRHPKGPWVVTLHFAAVSGRMECVGVDVRAFTTLTPYRGQPELLVDGEEPEPLTTREALRGVHLAELVEEEREGHAEMLRDLLPKRRAEPATRPWRDRPKGPGGRPPMHDDAFFEQIADEYREAHALSNTPRLAIAKKHQVEPTTASNWIRECRRRNKLPPTTRGRAKSADTPKRRRKK